jgi:hypothetical protein
MLVCKDIMAVYVSVFIPLNATVLKQNCGVSTGWPNGTFSPFISGTLCGFVGGIGGVAEGCSCHSKFARLPVRY